MPYKYAYYIHNVKHRYSGTFLHMYVWLSP